MANGCVANVSDWKYQMVDEGAETEVDETEEEEVEDQDHANDNGDDTTADPGRDHVDGEVADDPSHIAQNSPWRLTI